MLLVFNYIEILPKIRANRHLSKSLKDLVRKKMCINTSAITLRALWFASVCFCLYFKKGKMDSEKMRGPFWMSGYLL